jgi:subtilase family serine protease
MNKRISQLMVLVLALSSLLFTTPVVAAPSLQLPDLAFKLVEERSGDIVLVVLNQGQATAHNFTVVAKNDEPGIPLNYAFTVRELKPGATHPVGSIYLLLMPGSTCFDVRADVNNTVVEWNERNNRYVTSVNGSVCNAW